MFEDKLLSFYKKNLSLWSLVYKHFLKSLIIVFCSVTFGGILIFRLLYVNLGLGNNMYDYTYIYLIYFFVYMGLCMFILYEFIVYPAEAFSIKKFGITFKSSDWRVFIYAIIQSYLFKERILVFDDKELNKNSLEFLIKSLEKRKEVEEKSNIITILSTFGGLFFLFSIPVWSGLNTWIFNHAGINTLSDAITYFFKMIILISIVVFSIWMPLKTTILDDLSRKKSSKISYLITALTSISFALENPNFIRIEKKTIIKHNAIKLIIEEKIFNS
ncbi:hypothetical protein OCD70_22975 [Bacillus tropicus]|uniref:hypothetical protein n=1 Tax=Bacillus tropicus TaxID=2026188 RepID=UPI0021D1CA5C|nr:hypothetical protein [Bacillus tropicus]MCU5002927.1 hypothetical protein [Bacillus tropicus]